MRPSGGDDGWSDRRVQAARRKQDNWGRRGIKLARHFAFITVQEKTPYYDVGMQSLDP